MWDIRDTKSDVAIAILAACVSKAAFPNTKASTFDPTRADKLIFDAKT